CGKWIQNMKKNDLWDKSTDCLYKNYKICSDHFEQSQILCTGRLVWNAVPTKLEIPIQRKPIKHKLQFKNEEGYTSAKIIKFCLEEDHSYAKHYSLENEPDEQTSTGSHSSIIEPEPKAPLEVTDDTILDTQMDALCNKEKSHEKPNRSTLDREPNEHSTSGNNSSTNELETDSLEITEKSIPSGTQVDALCSELKADHSYAKNNLLINESYEESSSNTNKQEPGKGTQKDAHRRKKNKYQCSKEGKDV
ncbi:52 kDa repressor of the inhibitor of the protein kinase-like, partial [Anneissia japonica]|uniref:52 kDa repressor of the inhibitor of the protein kinase-like n=1 Tax=Anneissia japonica TaxID=1529436 RepID=UPI0014257D80